MKNKKTCAGMTLVEVMVAVVLVSVAAATVYQGFLYSYKAMMRSRARLEAQGIAYDILWEKFNTPYKDLLEETVYEMRRTPERSIFSTNGIIDFAIFPEAGDGMGGATVGGGGGAIERWEMWVQVWAPENSVLFSVIDEDGTVISEYPEPLAEYELFRYKGDRQ